MTPKYQHDCKHCLFLGHYFGHDVYYCPNDTLKAMGSIIARNGNDREEYASTPLAIIQEAIADPEHRIECSKWAAPMVYRDYVFSDECTPHTKAMVAGIFCKSHELFKQT